MEMSTNWADLSSIEKTKHHKKHSPEEYAVISLFVHDVEDMINILDVPGAKIDPEKPIKLTVDHSPKEDNPAHTDILRYTDSDADLLAIRYYFQGKFMWEDRARVPKPR